MKKGKEIKRKQKRKRNKWEIKKGKEIKREKE